jgi:membrane-associated phospholipid phosphatase
MIAWPAWDLAATLWINQHHHPLLDAVFVAVSWLGDRGRCWLVVAALLLIFGRRRERLLALIFLAGLLVTEFALMPLLRAHCFRLRPYLEFPGLIRQLGFPWPGASFPSAHAHLWTQATLLFGLAYRRWRAPLIVLALLTFYARPYAGMHYVLDVLGGIGLGGIMGLLEVALAARLGLLRKNTSDPG